MRKIYVGHKFRVRQSRIRKKKFRKIRNRKLRFEYISTSLDSRPKVTDDDLRRLRFSKRVIAPKDLRAIENLSECLSFFRELRSPENVMSHNNRGVVRLDMRTVEHIDYASVTIINAITDDLASNGILLSGKLPDNLDCKTFMIDSGFLNNMFVGNQPAPKAVNAHLIFFEKGSGKLSEVDNQKVGELIKDVVHRLTGKRKHNQKLRTVILEICGNAIEHASTPDRQWLLGLKYGEDRVQFTVADVGKGILETLHRKYSRQISDFLAMRSDHEILERAFIQKYGSSTQETNRNKGLPAIKAAFENGTIINLVAITNNVMLNFNTPNLSRTLPRGAARFKGTFYQWEVTKECIS